MTFLLELAGILLVAGVVMIYSGLIYMLIYRDKMRNLKIVTKFINIGLGIATVGAIMLMVLFFIIVIIFSLLNI